MMKCYHNIKWKREKEREILIRAVMRWLRDSFKISKKEKEFEKIKEMFLLGENHVGDVEKEVFRKELKTPKKPKLKKEIIIISYCAAVLVSLLLFLNLLLSINTHRGD